MKASVVILLLLAVAAPAAAQPARGAPGRNPQQNRERRVAPGDEMSRAWCQHHNLAAFEIADARTAADAQTRRGQRRYADSTETPQVRRL